MVNHRINGLLAFGLALMFTATGFAANRRILTIKKAEPAQIEPKLLHITPKRARLKPHFSGKLEKAPVKLTPAQKQKLLQASIQKKKYNLIVPTYLTVARASVNKSYLYYTRIERAQGGYPVTSGIDGSTAYSSPDGYVGVNFYPTQSGPFLVDFLMTTQGPLNVPYSIYFPSTSSEYIVTATEQGHVTFLVQGEKGQYIDMRINSKERCTTFHGCEITPAK